MSIEHLQKKTKHGGKRHNASFQMERQLQQIIELKLQKNRTIFQMSHFIDLWTLRYGKTKRSKQLLRKFWVAVWIAGTSHLRDCEDHSQCSTYTQRLSSRRPKQVWCILSIQTCSNMFKQSILDVIEMIQTCAMRPKNNELFGNTRVLFASKWHQTVWRHFHVALHIQFLLVSFPNQTYNSQFGSIWQNPACESTIHAKLWSFQANWLLNSCLCNSNVPCLPETKAWLARQNLGQGALQCNNPETASSTVLQHVSQLFCHSIKLQNIWEFCAISPTTQKKLRERSWHFKSRITKSNGSCTKQPEQQPKSWFYHDN